VFSTYFEDNKTKKENKKSQDLSTLGLPITCVKASVINVARMGQLSKQVWDDFQAFSSPDRTVNNIVATKSTAVL
jgi:hypothetical protein